MKTDLPTISAAPSTAVDDVDSARPSVRRRRHRLLALCCVAAVLSTGFWLTSGGNSPTTQVSVDGRPIWVAGRRPTVAAALRSAHEPARDGRLFSAATHRVLDARAAPAQLFLDGRRTARGHRVRAGDRVVVHQGADAVERVIRRKVQVAGAGLPPVEDRIWVSTEPGYDEIDVGEVSGEIVSRANVSPGAPVHAEAGMVVALTFDDGPDPRWTPTVLQVLHDENIKATFCTVGYLAQRYPGLVRAEFDAGMTLCDHSMHHILQLPQRPHPQIIDEVNQAADAIRAVTGQDPTFYRPPGGNLNQDIIDTAHQRGLRVLKWSVDPRDYTKPPAPVILARIAAKVGPGSVILLHDGGGDRSQTVAMLKQLIDQLKARGFTFYAWQ